MSRVFTNGPGDRGSIPGLVIPKTQKMLLDAALFNTQHYKVRIKDKVEQSREWSSTLPTTPRCSSYWKGSLRVTLEYGRQLYLFRFIGNSSRWRSNLFTLRYNHFIEPTIYQLKYFWICHRVQSYNSSNLSVELNFQLRTKEKVTRNKVG